MVHMLSGMRRDCQIGSLFFVRGNFIIDFSYGMCYLTDKKKASVELRRTDRPIMLLME